MGRRPFHSSVPTGGCAPRSHKRSQYLQTHQEGEFDRRSDQPAKPLWIHSPPSQNQSPSSRCKSCWEMSRTQDLQPLRNPSVAGATSTRIVVLGAPPEVTAGNELASLDAWLKNSLFERSARFEIASAFVIVSRCDFKFLTLAPLGVHVDSEVSSSLTESKISPRRLPEKVAIENLRSVVKEAQKLPGDFLSESVRKNPSCHESFMGAHVTNPVHLFYCG